MIGTKLLDLVYRYVKNQIQYLDRNNDLISSESGVSESSSVSGTSESSESSSIGDWTSGKSVSVGGDWGVSNNCGWLVDGLLKKWGLGNGK